MRIVLQSGKTNAKTFSVQNNKIDGYLAKKREQRRKHREAVKKAKFMNLMQTDALRQEVNELNDMLKRAQEELVIEKLGGMLLSGGQTPRLKDSDSIVQASVDLQLERLKNQRLQKELDKLKAAHCDLNRRYQADVVSVKQQMDSLQQELQKQMKTNGDRVSQDQAAKRSSAAKNNSLLKSMTEEMDKHKQNLIHAEQTVESLQQKLQKQERAHSEKVSWDQAVKRFLTAQNKALLQKMAEEKKKHQQNMTHAEQTIKSLQHKLKKQSQAPLGQTSQDQLVTRAVKAEHNTICQKMRQEMEVLQHSATQREQMMAEQEKLNNQLIIQKNSTTELQVTDDQSLAQLRAPILEERKKTNFFLQELKNYKPAHNELTEKYKSVVLSEKAL
ncbi:golgin subfamily A member 3-like isoform X2 [Xyrichtys novacula]|uniref:Golgin subfamily A member 3-like isoform X2 n=1 Tax=Xyrichtys novacula TaxID=13765 RepID=A0AAV1FAF8_XYRNO|nr:golgin subfamily A member 3-like isoform X2 [Xyrichtys novacula]